jgi:hypothetical protein
MFSWTYIYSEEARWAEERRQLRFDLQSAVFASAPPASRWLFKLGQGLSRLGDRLQARYSRQLDCPSHQMSYRFN